VRTVTIDMAYTVKQLAQLAGVSVRTLHHYDEIGLLTPPVIGANGYRYYDDRSVLRLQTILFYRELDFPLATIKAVLDRPDFDGLAALQEQRAALEAKLGRLHRLIATIDRTISHLKGERSMSTKQLFAGLTPEQEKDYTKQAAQRWGEEVVRESVRKYQSCSSDEKARIAAEGEAVYRDLIALIPQGAASPTVQLCVERWRKHLEYFWTPNDEQCLGLALLYRDDPAFRKTFDAIDPRLATFMYEAVELHVNARRGG
jgi:MerR family transcriptional regulator, thiopeptide resistance regulator